MAGGQNQFQGNTMTYKAITAADADDLARQMSELSEQGWMPVGGPGITAIPLISGCRQGFEYVQMMVQKPTHTEIYGNPNRPSA